MALETLSYSNFAQGTVSGSFLAGDTDLDLVTGHGNRFPTAPFRCTLWNSTDYTNAVDAYWSSQAEVIQVTAKSANAFTTIARAQEGTAAIASTGGKTYTVTLGVTGAIVEECSQNRISVYGVKYYGAKGDGATDDTVAFNAAIAAANTAGGGTVWIQAGTYVITSVLTYYSNIKIRGEGKGTTVIKYTGSGSVFVQNSPGTRRYNVEITDLTIANYGTGTIALDLESCSNGRFHNIIITGSPGFTTGISLTGTDGYCVYNRFEDVYCGACTTGYIVGAAGSNSNTFINCRGNACVTGWNITDSNNNQIAFCQIESCTTGISITSTTTSLSNRNTIIGNRFENNTTNVNITSAYVLDTILMGNFPDTGTSIDSGTRTNWMDPYGATGSFIVYSAHSEDNGSFRFIRTTHGGSEQPCFVIEDTNNSTGTGVTLKVKGARVGGFPFRVYHSTTKLFEVDSYGDFTFCGGKRWTDGTVAPASGTWAVGDICWNTVPAAGSPLGWACITAGTPGTWAAFGYPPGKAETYGTVAPASGTWAVGDRCWNSDPVATEWIGWVCVSAGTPGTWKGFGVIES